MCLNSLINWAQTSTFESLLSTPNTNFESSVSTWINDGQAAFPYVITSSIYGDYFSNGFVPSNRTDTQTGTFLNAYSAITGKGVGNSTTYMVGYDTSTIILTGSARHKQVSGFYITNTTYTYKVIENGNMFSKAFGGISGNDPDYFTVHITGFNNNQPAPDTVEFYLADFRFTDNSKDYIVDHWTWVDLRPLGNVDSLKVFFSSTDVGMFGINTPVYFAMDHFNEPLYDPSMSNGGVLGINKNASSIQQWANQVTLTRGYRDIATPSLGSVTVGEETNAMGSADGTVVSLGDSGVAVVSFERAIVNGPGADFVIFENGFTLSPTEDFVELAVVEVSSDGIHYFRFPCISKTSTSVQTGTFGTTDVQLLHNIAGKYTGNFGTPFNLDDIPDYALLDKNNITHVKIIDVVGSVERGAIKDSIGNTINDPYTTNFTSGGFDLDAVGVIHSVSPTAITSVKNSLFEIYPNPCTDKIQLKPKTTGSYSIKITNVVGTVIEEKVLSDMTTLSTENWLNGIYLLYIENEMYTIIKQ